MYTCVNVVMYVCMYVCNIHYVVVISIGAYNQWHACDCMLHVHTCYMKIHDMLHEVYILTYMSYLSAYMLVHVSHDNKGNQHMQIMTCHKSRLQFSTKSSN